MKMSRAIENISIEKSIKIKVVKRMRGMGFLVMKLEQLVFFLLN